MSECKMLLSALFMEFQGQTILLNYSASITILSAAVSKALCIISYFTQMTLWGFFVHQVQVFSIYCYMPLCSANLWTDHERPSLKRLQVDYNDALRVNLIRLRWYSASKLLGSQYCEGVQKLMDEFIYLKNESENKITVGLENPQLNST